VAFHGILIIESDYYLLSMKPQTSELVIQPVMADLSRHVGAGGFFRAVYKLELRQTP
jgi:hypothetical protein